MCAMAVFAVFLAELVPFSQVSATSDGRVQLRSNPSWNTEVLVGSSDTSQLEPSSHSRLRPEWSGCSFVEPVDHFVCGLLSFDIAIKVEYRSGTHDNKGVFVCGVLWDLAEDV